MSLKHDGYSSILYYSSKKLHFINSLENSMTYFMILASINPTITTTIIHNTTIWGQGFVQNNILISRVFKYLFIVSSKKSSISPLTSSNCNISVLEYAHTILDESLSFYHLSKLNLIIHEYRYFLSLLVISHIHHTILILAT